MGGSCKAVAGGGWGEQNTEGAGAWEGTGATVCEGGTGGGIGVCHSAERRYPRWEGAGRAAASCWMGRERRGCRPCLLEMEHPLLHGWAPVLWSPPAPSPEGAHALEVYLGAASPTPQDQGGPPQLTWLAHCPGQPASLGPSARARARSLHCPEFEGVLASAQTLLKTGSWGSQPFWGRTGSLPGRRRWVAPMTMACHWLLVK